MMILRALALSLALSFLCTPAGRAVEPTSLVAPDELRTSNGRVWVYLPVGTAATAKLPCVLIGPAGSRMFHGMALAEGDKAEHLPWVAAGFAVVSFDMHGALPPKPTDAQFVKAAGDFLSARFGVSDGLAALDTALARYPQIDPERLYVVGHSSAATLALQLAAASDRFKACVSFAPVTDVGDDIKKVLPALDRAVPGFAHAIRTASPSHCEEAMHCPVFLFHADDDTGIPTPGIEAYRDALRAQGKTVEYVTVPTGGHYNSMIEQGVPKAIAWVKALGQK